ncbi:MAG: glycosyltransferase family 39 protein [Anaerolineae bacterium]
MTRRRFLPGIVLLLVLVAFALRLYKLDYQPLRGDESFGIQFAAHSWSWLLSNMAWLEPLPPLYYSFLHCWMQVAGQSEFTTRFLSLLFGVLTVPLIYLLGRSLGRPRAGVLAAFLMAINPFQVWHAQDVRNYTVWLALSMAALAFLLRAVREQRARYWAGYAGVTLLGLYTQYYELFMLLFHNLFFLSLLLARSRRREILRSSARALLATWLVVQATLGMLYGAWLIRGSALLPHYRATGESPPLWVLLSRSLTVFSLGETVPEALAAVALPFLLLLVVIGLGYTLKKDRFLALFLILYIIVPSLCVFIAAQVRPLFHERYLIVVSPALYLTFSHALIALRDELPRWRVVPLVIGVAFFSLSGAYSLSNHYWDPAYRKSPDWRALADHLAGETGLGDVIVLNYPDPTFSYYYRGKAPSFMLPRGPLSEETRTETAETLRFLSERYERIWFYPLKDVGWDSEGFVETWLNRHGRLIGERNISGFRWLIYRPLLLSLEGIQIPLAFRFGEAIELAGYEWEMRQDESSDTIAIEPGGALRLALYWQAWDEVETGYTVFIHLTDAYDRIWAQRDSIPQGGDFPTEEWMAGDIIVDPHSILLPSDTPSGDYLLAVGMYDSTSGQRLPVASTGGAGKGDRAIIARVRVW